MRHQCNFRPAALARPLRTVLVAAIAVVLGVGCAGEDAQIDHVAKARAAIEERDYRAAEIELKNALQKNPEDAEARLLLAEGHLRFGDGRAAETNLDKAEAIGMASSRLLLPRMNAWMLQKKFEPVTAVEADKLVEAEFLPEVRAEILAVQGVAHLALDDEAKAKEKFAAALALEPNSGPALVGDAQLALRAKDQERSLELARQASRMAPAYAPGWSLLGDLLRETGDLKAAEDAYSQAIKFRETNREDLLNRAIVRISRNDLEGALVDANTLRKRGHTLPHATFINGIVNLAKGNPEAARGDFEQVVANAPRYIVAACYLGQSHATTGNYEQAATHLAKCHKYYGANGAVRRLYAGVLAADLREGEAASVLKPVIEENKGEAADIELLARVQMLQGNPDEAVSLLQRLLEATEGSSATYLNLGYALVAAGEVEKSRAAFAEASKLGQAGAMATDEDAKFDLLEARALLQSGNTKAAIERLEAQIAAEPGNRPASNLLALALLRSGERDKARTLLEKILEEDPDYSVGIMNLASLRAQNGELEAARALLQPLYEREPDNSQILGMLAAIDAGLGNEAAVLPGIDKAIETAPNDPSLRLLKARAMKSQGRLDEALEAYQWLAARPKPDPVWLRELMATQRAANQSVAALDTGKRLAKLPAAQAQDLLRLRGLQLEAGDIAAASNTLREALERYPDNIAIRVARIEELALSRDLPAARKLLDDTKASLGQQEFPDLLVLEALVLVQEGDGARAVEIARRAHELDPNSKRTLDLARIQAAAGFGSETIDTLENWLAEHPDDQAALFVLGDALAKREEFEAAKATYERLLALAPNHPWALNNLAWLLREEDPARALGLAERALQQTPNAPGVMDTLAILLLARSEAGRSVELLRQANSLAPNSDEIKLHLARALVATDSREEALSLVQSLSGRSLAPATEKELADLRQLLGL